MNFFCGHERKTFGQVKAHLMTKHRSCACACAVHFVCAMFVHMAHEIEVLFHDEAI